MDSTLGQSAQNAPSSSYSFRRKAARLFSDKLTSSKIRTVLPIPGLHEFMRIAEVLIDSLRDSPYEHGRCSTLALRIEHLIDITVDMVQLDPDSVQELKRDLEGVQTAFGKASSPGRLDLGRAKRNLQALEDLEQQVDALVKFTEIKLNLQLALTQQDDKLKAIDAHAIQDQKILPPVTRPWWCKYQQPLITAKQESVTTCYRSGHVGRLPVVYVTYSSTSAIGTEKYIRQELDIYSQCLHPNVATVMGVTRGSRLNGVVFTSAALPVEEFLGRVSSLAILGRCLQEFEASSEYFRTIQEGRSYPGAAHVQPDGRVIIIPTNNFKEQITLFDFYL
ncbi:hypothetical protein FRC08_012500, partial [Ceratobasidium sp. 394]